MRTAHGAYRAGVRDPAPAQQFVQPGHGALRLFSKARAEIEKAMLSFGGSLLERPTNESGNLEKVCRMTLIMSLKRRTSGRLALTCALFANGSPTISAAYR